MRDVGLSGAVCGLMSGGPPEPPEEANFVSLSPRRCTMSD